MKFKQLLSEDNTTDIVKNNILTQFHHLLTQLIQLKSPTAESIRPRSLAKSIKIMEDGQNNAAQIAQITSQIDSLLQELQPYSNDPDVQSAIAQYNKVKSSNYSQTPKYTGSFNQQKFERFKQLLDKLEGTSKQSIATAPSTTGSSSQSTEDSLINNYKRFFEIQD